MLCAGLWQTDQQPDEEQQQQQQWCLGCRRQGPQVWQLMKRTLPTCCVRVPDIFPPGLVGFETRLWLPAERLYSMRPIQCLASSKILTPHPPIRPASVYPPPAFRPGTVSRARLGIYDINGDLGRNKRPAWFLFLFFFRCLWEFAEPLTYFSGGSCWQGRQVWKSCL